MGGVGRVPNTAPYDYDYVFQIPVNEQQLYDILKKAAEKRKLSVELTTGNNKRRYNSKKKEEKIVLRDVKVDFWRRNYITLYARTTFDNNFYDHIGRYSDTLDSNDKKMISPLMIAIEQADKELAEKDQ